MGVGVGVYPGGEAVGVGEGVLEQMQLESGSLPLSNKHCGFWQAEIFGRPMNSQVREPGQGSLDGFGIHSDPQVRGTPVGDGVGVGVGVGVTVGGGGGGGVTF